MTTKHGGPEQQGVAFPLTKDGKRSTTATGKMVVASALGPVDESTAKRVAKERNWRKGYRQYFEQMTAKSVESTAQCHAIAQSGLAAVYEHFEFLRDGQSRPLLEAMSAYNAPLFRTAVVRGGGERQELKVAYRNQVLDADGLRAQLANWQQRGIIEASHATSILRVIDHPECLADLPPMVLLGAGSEMGPCAVLLELGFTVIAIDLDRADVWTKLINLARHSSGTLVFPIIEAQTDAMSDEQLASLAGANLLTQAPEIATWLLELDRPMAIGAYAYLDGGDFVRVVVAMDMIMQTVAERSTHSVQFAYLLSPTDAFAVPTEVVDAAQAQYAIRSWLRPLQSLARLISGSRLCAPNVRRVVIGEQQRSFGIINSLVIQQGPNYTLAKRIQRWRSVVARGQGTVVSCNVAPATLTRSVTNNKLFAAGYAGAENFGAEAFEANTSNAVMTAQLINDLSNDQSASHPNVSLTNPEELFMEGANHGGFWRMAHQLASIIEVAVVVGTVKRIFSRAQAS